MEAGSADLHFCCPVLRVLTWPPMLGLFCREWGRKRNVMPYQRLNRFHRLAMLLALMLFMPAARADEEDTRFLLHQQSRQAAERMAGPEDGLVLHAPPGALLYEGKVHTVPSTRQALEPAIYIAINTGQWERLAEFVSRYRLLQGHRPALAQMALALLARQEGDVAQALRLMQSAQAAEPQDARIALELARLLFEDNRDTEARAAFTRAQQAGLPDTVQALVGQYQQALKERSGWHGSMAVGLGHNSNINQASGDVTCFLELGGVCVFERRMPQAIRSGMLNYELALQRRWHLGGNHNLQLRPVSYGSYYQRQGESGSASISDYGNATSVLYLGYQWLDARRTLNVTPYVEHFYRNRHTDYVAHGLQVEGQFVVGSRWRLGASADTKRYVHTDQGRRVSGSDYTQHQAGLSASYALSPRFTVYGGADMVRKKYAVDQASTRDKVLRAGVYYGLEGAAGLFVSATGIWRNSRSDAFDGFLGARRHDKQQVFIASIGANNWKLAGLAPELRVRYSRNRSNVDWAFGFEQSEVSVMLRRHF